LEEKCYAMPLFQALTPGQSFVSVVCFVS